MDASTTCSLFTKRAGRGFLVNPKSNLGEAKLKETKLLVVKRSAGLAGFVITSTITVGPMING